MFKTKYKLLVILFIALVFFNPVKTLAMFDGTGSNDDAAQTQAQGEKSAAPVDYNRQLEEIFREPVKQARIEVRVIQKLHEIDRDGVFSEKFKIALDACERLRSTPSEQVMRNGKPLRGPATDNNPTFQGLLAARFVIIPSLLLENLYNPEIQRLSLILIRTLNDMQNEAPNYTTFFTRTNQLFYHSRRLLAATICPQIIEKYGITDTQGIRFRTVKQTITEGRNAGHERNTQVCEFTFQDKPYACLLRKKTGGVHFGGFVEVGEIENLGPDNFPILKPESKQTYFLKAYHGYPATESKDSGDTKLDTIQMATSTDEAPENLPVQPLDLREPFIYSMLDKLELGPKAHFMINEYINSGFFIVTESLSTHGEEFVELEKINDKLQANKSNLTNINTILHPESDYSLKSKMVQDLTLASIFVNIFRLTDIKGDNIGYVAQPDLLNHLVDCSDYRQLKLMMIDFLTPHPETPQAPIIESFLQGTFFSESNSGVKPYKSIISQCKKNFRLLLPYIARGDFPPQYIDKRNIRIVKNAFTAFQQIASIKVAQGQAAFGEFQARSGNFDGMLEQTKAEIFNLLSPSTSTGIPVHVVLSLNPALADSELSAYVGLASRNYHKLENFLNRSHGDWINDFTGQIQELIAKYEQDQST